MIDQGLVDEVIRLLQTVPAGHPLMKAVGYRQVVEAIRTSPTARTLSLQTRIGYKQSLSSLRSDRQAKQVTNEELIAEIVKQTKIFVRRQYNWLKRWEVDWVGSNQDGLKVVQKALKSN